jgi:hypothetical protein
LSFSATRADGLDDLHDDQAKGRGDDASQKFHTMRSRFEFKLERILWAVFCSAIEPARRMFEV